MIMDRKDGEDLAGNTAGDGSGRGNLLGKSTGSVKDPDVASLDLRGGQ